MSWKKHKRAFLTLAFLLLALPVKAYGQSASPNYQIDEAQFGTGAAVDMNSSSYQSQGSSGSLGVGSASSASYDAETGFLTASEPFLEMVVDGATLDLGTLSTSISAVGTTTFRVRSYLSSEYSVVTMSQPPTSEGGAQLDAMAVAGVAVPGIEQFGINVVDNSSPNAGANPINFPSDEFADGGVVTGYGTPNVFKYNVGDTIAKSAVTSGNQAVGQTNYTITYIANISPITEAGVYSMNHDLVVVASY